MILVLICLVVSLHLLRNPKKVWKPRSRGLGLEFRFWHRVVNYLDYLLEHVIAVAYADTFKVRLYLDIITNFKDLDRSIDLLSLLIETH